MSRQIAHQILVAMTGQDTAVLNKSLCQDIFLQIRGQGRLQIYWTRSHVVPALVAESQRWNRPALKILDLSREGGAVTAAFQIRERVDGARVSQDHFASMHFRRNQVAVLHLYRYDELQSAAPGPWFVPAVVLDTLARSLGIDVPILSYSSGGSSRPAA